MATVVRRGRDGAEPRLDPVRWRRPGQGTLVRLGAVAALLVTAAAVIWSRPPTCAPAGGPATRSTGGRSSTLPGAVIEADKPRAGASHAGSEAPPATAKMPPAGAGVPRGSVGVPVRLAEPAALALVHPGDRVDLLRVDEPGTTTSVAAGALVLGVTGADDPTAGGLLLALKPAEAQKAVATPGHGFAVLIRPE